MRIHTRSAALFALLVCVSFSLGEAETIPDRNVNMVSGTSWPGGDPFLQRQNEPSMAVSTRNPLHLAAGNNDYRTVDLPGLPGIKVIGDAWLGFFRSYDGGFTWRSSLLPGYPQDNSPEGLASPLKGYQAGADPVVRAAAGGLFLYAGIVLNRDENPLGALFVARLLDHNDKEAGDSIRYVDTILVDQGTSGQFMDKPWLFIDIPRPNSQTCTVAGQTLPGGMAYLANTVLVGGDNNIRSKMIIRSSSDCGATWGNAIKLSETHAINQGAAIAVDDQTGAVHVVWRRISNGIESHALLYSRSTDFGQTFSKATVIAEITPYEQGTTGLSFRTTMFPTIAAHAGTVYVAWSQRDSITADGRVVLINSSDGINWSAPLQVAPQPISAAANSWDDRGHQFMPTLTFSQGKLMLAWYSNHLDHTIGVYTPLSPSGQYQESRKNVGDLADPAHPEKVFNAFIQDIAPDNTPLLRRHTLDVWVAQADPGVMPVFQTIRASQYLIGSLPGETEIRDLQANPPNFKLFQLGNVPFMGDYIDLASPSIVPVGSDWRFNSDPVDSVLGHVVWTDNRDVRPPPPGKTWADYTPVNSAAKSGSSLFDPNQVPPQCVEGQGGMRNQNIYTARITGGLFAGSPGNSKPLGSIERAFVVWVQNTRKVTSSYRITILNQPPGGRASLLQFGQLDTLDVTIPPRSSISRSVFVTSTDPRARVNVKVEQISAPGADLPLPDGLDTTVILNPDIANPDIANPDIANPDIANPDIANAEVYNPDIANPDIANASIANPDIANPDIANPDIANPDIANPDIANPDIANPDIANPDIANPDIANPDIANPDIANGSVTDTIWESTNEGNTAASYSVNLLLNGEVPDGFKLQLIVSRLYTTPVARGCDLGLQRHHVVLANIPNPVFDDPADLLVSDVTDPSDTNATIWLAPGDTALITLRVVDPNRFDTITFDAAAAVTPVVVSHAVNTENLGDEFPRPSISLTILTGQVPDAIVGTAYQTQLQSIGGVGAKTWSQEGLPSEFTLSSSGLLSGTASSAGSFPFQATVTDSAFTPNVESRTVAFRIVDLSPSLFLEFVTQPQDVIEGGTTSEGITVRARDASGAVLAGVSIRLNIGQNPCNTFFSERSAVTNEEGIADFGAIRNLSACYDYTLRASGEMVGFSPNTRDSNLFDVFGFGGAASLPVERGGHTATVLQDGTVLVVGGRDTAGAFLDDALIYDPTSNSWRTTGTLNAPRWDHTATLLNDGTVLIVGGVGIPEPLADQQHLVSIELYDPETEEFSTVASLQTARAFHTATLRSDGSVVIVAGENITGILASIEVYAAGEVTGSGSLSFARARHTATLVGDTIYIMGGGFGSEGVTDVELIQTSGEVVAGGDLLVPRVLHSAIDLGDGRILVAGGYGPTDGYETAVPVASTEFYTPDTASSIAGPSMNTPHTKPIGGVLADGTILIAGGAQPQPLPDQGVDFNDVVEIFDPVEETFTLFGRLSAPRATIAWATLSNGHVLAIAGFEERETGVFMVPTVEKFYPQR